MAEPSQRQASEQPAEQQSRQRQAGPRSREPRQDLQPGMDPLQRLQALADNSPQAAQLRRLREIANNSPQAAQLRRLQELANNSPQANEPRQLQAMAQGAERRAEAEPTTTTNATAKPEATTGKPETATAKPNLTGLPDHLKSNIEALSGLSMDAVRVHYNSTKPAQLNALAYAQGSDIHLGPGQEQLLPHEAWHVVQQAQGRVRPTLQMAGGVAVNDDAGLEREADVMGGRAAIGEAEYTSTEGSAHPANIISLMMPYRSSANSQHNKAYYHDGVEDEKKEDDGDGFTLVKPKKKKKDPAKQAQKEKELEEKLGKLNTHTTKWMGKTTEIGTRDTKRQGSGEEHGYEEQAKNLVKLGDFDGAIKMLNEAVNIRSKKQNDFNPGDAGFQGHIKAIDFLKKIIDDLKKFSS